MCEFTTLYIWCGKRTEEERSKRNGVRRTEDATGRFQEQTSSCEEAETSLRSDSW